MSEIVKPRDVARYFRRDCGGLRDALQLEMVAAQYYLQMTGVISPEGVPVGDAASAGIVADLEKHGDELSHAILRALAHLAGGDVQRRSAEAVARLAEQGIGLPKKLAGVGEIRIVAAWRDTEGAYEDQYALFAECAHPPHTIAAFVERGYAKHIGLLPALDELDYPHAMEALDVPEAAEILRDLLDRSYPAELGDPDDYRILIARARARSSEAALRAA